MPCFISGGKKKAISDVINTKLAVFEENIEVKKYEIDSIIFFGKGVFK